MVPEAPALLSISTLRPVRCLSGSARKRAMTSVPPPAGKPTRIFSGLSGRPVCWRAPQRAARRAMHRRARGVDAAWCIAFLQRHPESRRLLVSSLAPGYTSRHQTPRQFGALARRPAHLDRFGIGRIALQAAAVDALGDGGEPEQREGEVVVPVRNGVAAGAPAVGGDVFALRSAGRACAKSTLAKPCGGSCR